MSGVYGYIGEDEVYEYLVVSRMVMDQYFLGTEEGLKIYRGGLGGVASGGAVSPPGRGLPGNGGWHLKEELRREWCNRLIMKGGYVNRFT
jgi:hypothetical protein